MPGRYGDKEKTKSKTVTKTKNGKTVTKSKTKTKVKGKKKAEKNIGGMQIGKMLSGLASTAKKKDPYDSTSNQTFKGDIKQQLKRKAIHKPYTGK